MTSQGHRSLGPAHPRAAWGEPSPAAQAEAAGRCCRAAHASERGGYQQSSGRTEGRAVLNEESECYQSLHEQ